MNILVTGGIGYIGSHTCVELINQGYNVIIVDNLVNSKIETLNRIEQISGYRPIFYQIDIVDVEKLRMVFTNHAIDAVIHFAGLKAVGESVSMPLKYYENNVLGTIRLVETMNQFDVKKLVFSSSATVYGNPKYVPIPETSELHATNPYGRTKLFNEEILRDLANSDAEWSISLLRYFNPIGAHESGLIGEDPQGIPNNLMPLITQVASGKMEKLFIYGNDYNTYDGTGVRDYIHVCDLARGHINALNRVCTVKGIDDFNLGTGSGYSVLDVVRNFERANNVRINYEMIGRRLGDVSECYADCSKATEILNWKAEKNLIEMCRDSWNWQAKDQDGLFH